MLGMGMPPLTPEQELALGALFSEIIAAMRDRYIANDIHVQNIVITGLAAVCSFYASLAAAGGWNDEDTTKRWQELSDRAPTAILQNKAMFMSEQSGHA